MIGDAHGISKASTCRVICRVSLTINRILFNKGVGFPPRQVLMQNMGNFFAVRDFPGVVGCIDGTHVEIVPPSDVEHAYINRHQKKSINCLVVCGPDLKIYYFLARWPGAIHDARVFSNSTLCVWLNNGNNLHNGVILGDSAYPLRPDLLTPIVGGNLTAAQHAYNAAHKSTRQVVERCIGLLKVRWRCLHRGLRLRSVALSCQVMKTCAILHNLCIAFDVDAPIDDIEIEEDNLFHDGNNDNDDAENNLLHQGQARRHRVVQQFVQ